MNTKTLFRAAGLRQADVAAALKVSEATLSRWVHRGIPGDRVIEVSKATGIAAAALRPDLAAAFSRSAA